MPPPSPPRKLVKHYNNPGHAHFLTFSCFQRRPLLNDDHRRTLLARAIDAATTNHSFELWGFVFMPDHVHLLVYPMKSEYVIDALLYAVKRPFSTRIKHHLLSTSPELVSDLTIRERPGKYVFRFWQEGGGYDHDIYNPSLAVRDLEYMHDNPVRRGLCANPADWRWSSYRTYHEDGFADPDLPKVVRFRGD